MDRSKQQEAGTLVYPKHQLTPQDLLNFSEMSGFVDEWKSLGLNVEFDLLALQISIMADPRKVGMVIRGTGGLRKMEFSPPTGVGGRGRKRGKRNACRVCYAYFEEFHTVLLVSAYAKGRKEDLSDDERRVIKREIERIRHCLSMRFEH